jgi:hypothetical protein
MYKYLLLIVIACSQISCKDKVNADPKEVATFYNTIQEAFGAHYEPQHLFLDKASEAVTKVSVDNNAVIDTKELRELLLNAKKSCTERMRIVASVKEVDTNIDYKNKVGKSIDVFSKACDKEFKDFIDLLDLKVENKLDKLTQIVQPTLYTIETAAKDCEAAGNELAVKYGIKK